MFQLEVVANCCCLAIHILPCWPTVIPENCHYYHTKIQAFHLRHILAKLTPQVLKFLQAWSFIWGCILFWQSVWLDIGVQPMDKIPDIWGARWAFLCAFDDQCKILTSGAMSVWVGPMIGSLKFVNGLTPRTAGSWIFEWLRDEVEVPEGFACFWKHSLPPPCLHLLLDHSSAGCRLLRVLNVASLRATLTAGD